jgi:hypothetical protein
LRSNEPLWRTVNGEIGWNDRLNGQQTDISTKPLCDSGILDVTRGHKTVNLIGNMVNEGGGIFGNMTAAYRPSLNAVGGIFALITCFSMRGTSLCS